MQWPAHAIFWHLYPLRFVDGEFEAVDTLHHRLGRIQAYLDYVIDLGANGLLLAPVFASQSHGYDTLDHYRIDPRLGDADDFAELLAAAHQRGIKVVLDGVFNHLARGHEIVQRAIAAGPGTTDGDWIRWSGDHPYCFEGSENLVELNFGSPAVRDYIAGVMIHWLDVGIDGWRLDAAYAAGSAAWAPIVASVRERHPDAWLLGEVLHGDYAGFVTESGFDTVTQYELWKAIWSSLNDRNFFELDWTLRRNAEFSAVFRPQTFIGNHDVTRIASQLTDRRNLEIAIALLLLLPGTPSIYAGDEQGFTGVKEHAPHGDDAIRPPFPATSAEFLPFGADVLRTYQHLIAVRRQHGWIADAIATPREVTSTLIVIDVADASHRLTVAFNCGDEPVRVEANGRTAEVPAHHWALV